MICFADEMFEFQKRQIANMWKHNDFKGDASEYPNEAQNFRNEFPETGYKKWDHFKNPYLSNPHRMQSDLKYDQLDWSEKSRRDENMIFDNTKKEYTDDSYMPNFMEKQHHSQILSKDFHPRIYQPMNLDKKFQLQAENKMHALLGRKNNMNLGNLYQKHTHYQTYNNIQDVFLKKKNSFNPLLKTYPYRSIENRHFKRIPTDTGQKNSDYHYIFHEVTESSKQPETNGNSWPSVDQVISFILGGIFTLSLIFIIWISVIGYRRCFKRKKVKREKTIKTSPEPPRIKYQKLNQQLKNEKKLSKRNDEVKMKKKVPEYKVSPMKEPKLRLKVKQTSLNKADKDQNLIFQRESTTSNIKDITTREKQDFTPNALLIASHSNEFSYEENKAFPYSENNRKFLENRPTFGSKDFKQNSFDNKKIALLKEEIHKKLQKGLKGSLHPYLQTKISIQNQEEINNHELNIPKHSEIIQNISENNEKMEQSFPQNNKFTNALSWNLNESEKSYQKFLQKKKQNPQILTTKSRNYEVNFANHFNKLHNRHHFIPSPINHDERRTSEVDIP